MTGADRLDACCDAGALIRATAARDHEGMRVILDLGDNRAVAEVLSLIVVTACRGYGEGFITWRPRPAGCWQRAAAPQRLTRPQRPGRPRQAPHAPPT